ncbi:hypothetical protein JCGZ_24137 [Jatropha curcas]|uniref:Uncharacterized protein n=1 Tax=Jatropha curcas TaxID=180498 RepID=A0A067LHK2_JATCU|nr:hypothetical protein JCGZ_24137 [Jatropha curcas]
MARSRAVDLDASGSGPHGGCGRGHSTCGRGGTIPPPSSSDKSGASSSAQPLVPQSLPSTPSSSAPLSRPVKSSPTSQSPTALDAFRMGRGYDGYANNALEKLCALRYADFTYRMRKSDPDTADNTLVTPTNTTIHPTDTPATLRHWIV